ncbi:MAG TPA: indolepyruvate oxidoreductase subunit beta [Sediminispirochaeta sp.]|nr:indolepyruvate oxidoreductase subunit beta [Sediminispirochaeta sp.]
MKLDIILAGVGGQGILSIATVIGYAALESGLHLKQAEVHGMSQRGGDVQSHLRISDREIFSDLIPQGEADIILSVEPMESLRYLPYLSQEGWLVTNTTPYKNISDYPSMDKILEQINKVPRHIAIDADALAKELDNSRGMNMVMAGAASLFMDLDFEKLKAGIRYIFGRKGEEVVEKNIATLEAGRKFSQEHRNDR